MPCPTRVLALAAASILSGCLAPSRTVEATGADARIEWLAWSDDVFARAQREHKLVLLDLEAVWCHWCHVMDEVTYRDPAVVALVREHYLAVKVDQDSRPDLSNRYEDYGWPATIVFRADGAELAKRSGFLEPRPMAGMLAAFVSDPTPGPSVLAEDDARAERTTASAGVLDDALRAELEDAHRSAYDREHGGWGRGHKWLDPPSVEYALTLALENDGPENDAEAARMARATLDAALALIDPVWGGVYQYSTDDSWDHPHFEKLMSFQGDDLGIYALAYALWNDPRHLAAAQAIHRYVREFLTSPEGAFYTSQDADLVQGEHAAEYFALADAERRARGIPRIDTHVYARENGWAIRGLARLHAYTGDEDALAEARRAAEWIVAQRALAGGGFRHDEVDPAGPYLGDTLAMAQAFLALYEATAERVWLARALAASDYMARTFVLEDRDGYATAAKSAGSVLEPAPQRDENVGLARLENLLNRLTGASEHRARAERALRWLSIPAVARRPFPSGVLLAERELAREPLHATVVGSKSDPAARALFRAALAIPSPYRRIEWLDAAEGPLPGPDAEYPTLARAAAFACADGRCSSPAFAPEEVRARIESLRR